MIDPDDQVKASDVAGSGAISDTRTQCREVFVFSEVYATIVNVYVVILA